MSSNFLKIYKGTTYAPQDTTPSNPVDGDIYYDSVLNKFRGYQNGSWQDLITDGSDGINYVKNSGAEAGIDGYVTYADAAATSPVDGLGGSPSFTTWTRTTVGSEILRQDASFKLTKSSGDAQGEGVAYNLTIDPRDKNDKLQISFDYKNLDSNYVNGDLKIYVYDIDNSVLLGNVVNDDDGDVLVSPADGGSFYGEVQATDSLNYRLIFHIASTTAANWDVSVDRIKVGPVSLNLVTYERSEIINVAGSGAFTGGTILVNRTGNQVTVQSQTALTFPAQTTPKSDDGIIPEWARPSITRWNLYINNGANYVARANVTSTGAFAVDFSNWDGSDDATETDDSAFMSISYGVDENIGLVSNNQLTQAAVYIEGGDNAGTATTANVTDIDFGEVLDPLDSWDGTQFTAPRSGFYSSKGSIHWTASQTGFTRAYIDGALDKEIGNPAGLTNTHYFSWEGYLEKGQTLSIRHTSGGTLQSGVPRRHWITITSNPDFTSYGVLNPKTEYLEASRIETTTGLPAQSIYDDVSEITLSPGTWDIGYTAVLRGNSGDNSLVFGIGTISGDNAPGSDVGVDIFLQNANFASNGRRLMGTCFRNNVTVTTTTTFYGKWRREAVNSTDWGGTIWARRIK